MKQNRQINLPVQLIEYCISKGLLNELRVFLAAKLISPGRLQVKGDEDSMLTELLGRKHRTVLSYFHKLVRMGWVGYDQESKTFYVRSWRFIRSQQTFYRRSSVRIGTEEIRNFQAFIAGVVISYQIKKHQAYNRRFCRRHQNLLIHKNRKGVDESTLPVISYKGKITSQGTTARQRTIRDLTEYYGLSNQKIATLLNCSYTHASSLKHLSAKAGYIHLRPHFEIVEILDKPSDSVRPLYYKFDEVFAKKLRFLTDVVDGRKMILLVKQQHDEITPHIIFHRIRYIK